LLIKNDSAHFIPLTYKIFNLVEQKTKTKLERKKAINMSQKKKIRR